MTKLKNTLSILFLVLLTAVMIILPIFFNSFGLQYSFDKKIFWQYTAQTSSALTSKQVIDFCNNSFQSGSYNITENYDNETMHNSTIRLLESVFEEDAEICNHIKDLVENDIKKYSQQYYLSSIDNKPTILNMISVSLFSEDEYIEFTYEAQTQTLISFLYDRISGEVENCIDIIGLKNALNKYYKNKLQLSENQFVSEFDKGYINYNLWDISYKEYESEMQMDN